MVQNPYFPTTGSLSEVTVKLEYSLSLQLEKIINSCTSQIKVDNGGQSTIIVLDGSNDIDQATLKKESNKVNVTQDVLRKVEEEITKTQIET